MISKQPMWFCVVYPLQYKFLYKISNTSIGPCISNKQIGYHFHLLDQPHPCRVHSWQDIFPTQIFGFVHQNSCFGLAPDKKIYLLLMSTAIYLFFQAWAAHYNQLEQTSVLFYGGLIRLCITIIVHRKLSFLIFLFITVFTSI